jgi:dihydroorotate dehydrogenase electron transfer subunit
MTLEKRAHRDSLFVEDARILATEEFPGEQFVLRLHAPLCAARAEPGSFVHVRCDEAVPMRRPLSIMRADAGDGWIEVLFKVVGGGLGLLGQRRVGETVSTIGPIGRGFRPSPARRRPLLIGGGVGIPPMVFLADHLRADSDAWRPLILMGSEIPFPFAEQRSQISCNWLDASVDRAMPLIEDWAYPSRLASLAGYDGVFRGYVTELADQWLASLSEADRAEVEIFSCGPTPMLKAVADLARRYDLPCQVSLEEFMACAVGGCAGCTVLVAEDDGPAMKRVCVDGPVFEAARVFPKTA